MKYFDFVREKIIIVTDYFLLDESKYFQEVEYFKGKFNKLILDIAIFFFRILIRPRFELYSLRSSIVKLKFLDSHKISYVSVS